MSNVHFQGITVIRGNKAAVEQNAKHYEKGSYFSASSYANGSGQKVIIDGADLDLELKNAGLPLLTPSPKFNWLHPIRSVKATIANLQENAGILGKLMSSRHSNAVLAMGKQEKDADGKPVKHINV